jgi:hypothetical protein
MSHFIVEHNRDGHYIMETISGVEDIDMSSYKDLMGVWVCDSWEECNAVQKELQEMRHARSSKQS